MSAVKAHVVLAPVNGFCVALDLAVGCHALAAGRACAAAWCFGVGALCLLSVVLCTWRVFVHLDRAATREAPAP